jgi:lipopolysaccharide transport system ATP-binding protein
MHRKEIARKFDEIINFAEVEEFIDTPVKRYSSGMYVRLAFAVAAHLEPEILVVDEVLAVGDVMFQKKCLGKLGDVAREGRTVLFVSHDMGAIRRLCPLGLVLDRGQITYRGRAEDAIESYLSNNGERNSWIGQNVTRSHPFYFVSVRVIDDSGVENSRFPMGSTVSLELCTKVTRTLSSSHLHVMVTYKGTPLFRTFDTDEHPELLEVRPEGDHRFLLNINTEILKPGLYSVTVDLGVRPAPIFEKFTDIVTFELFDPEGDFDRGWSDRRIGVIRAPVKWEVDLPVESKVPS